MKITKKYLKELKEEVNEKIKIIENSSSTSITYYIGQIAIIDRILRDIEK